MAQFESKAYRTSLPKLEVSKRPPAKERLPKGMIEEQRYETRTFRSATFKQEQT